jgi:predicted RNA-binding Zn ribbon-like protein
VTLPSWAHPQETRAAPLPLLLVQAFVNTWQAETGTDLLARPDSAAPWLREAGLIGPDAVVPPAGLRQARAVRDSLRALLAHNAGGPRPAAEQLAPLPALARRGRPRLSVDPAGRMLLDAQPRGSLSAGLLGLLLVVRDAQQQGSWSRLKTCRNPDCRWAFFDRSHAHRGAWCDMATCGNMIKNRNFRARHR